jgi:hypothetical protein
MVWDALQLCIFERIFTGKAAKDPAHRLRASHRQYPRRLRGHIWELFSFKSNGSVKGSFIGLASSWEMLTDPRRPLMRQSELVERKQEIHLCANQDNILEEQVCLTDRTPIQDTSITEQAICESKHSRL